MNIRKATIEITIAEAGIIINAIERKEKLEIESQLYLLNKPKERATKLGYATTKICEETIEELRRLKEFLEKAEEIKNKIADAFKED